MNSYRNLWRWTLANVRTVAGIALLAALASCGMDNLGPDQGSVDDFTLPEPDTSLDAERLVIGAYLATPCAFSKFGDGLAHLRDRDEWVLADIFFGTSPNDPLEGPREGDLEVVRAHDARILHIFNVPAVRARVLLSQIPHLVSLERQREGHWITVRDVPDATRYDLEVNIGFQRPPRDTDLELIEDLGGRVTNQLGSINFLAAILPDRSLPELRSGPDVAYVEVNGVHCLD